MAACGTFRPDLNERDGTEKTRLNPCRAKGGFPRFSSRKRSFRFRPNPVIAHAQTGGAIWVRSRPSGRSRDVWSVTRSKAAQGTCGTRYCAGTGCSAGGACLARCNSMAPFAARWGASGPSPGCPNQVASVCDRNSIRPPHLAAREAADVERAILAPPVTLLAMRTFEQLMTALTFSSHLA